MLDKLGAAGARQVAVGPCPLDQRALDPAVAALGDVGQVHAVAGRAFPRHEAQIAHELALAVETAQVADLGHDGDGSDQPDAAQRLQSIHHRGERPGGS